MKLLLGACYLVFLLILAGVSPTKYEFRTLSSLEFFVLCSKSLDFHVPLLRHESTYKIYHNGHLSTIVHEILV